MTRSSIPGRVVGSAISIARLPADGLLLVLGRSALGQGLRQTVDRTDATVRGIAGTLIRDDQMAADAHRRREAADARNEAMDLRERADDLAREAEAEVREAKAQAERQRQNAQRRSKERERKAR